MQDNLITAVTKEEIQSAILRKTEEYKNIYNKQKLVIVSDMTGAFVFLADFIRELPLAVSIKFIFIKKIGEEKKVIMDEETKEALKDEHVLIFTDIFNRGKTMQKISELVKDCKPQSIRILALANKPNADKVKDLQVEYLFELEHDKKVVGYGLANSESYRGLKSLYYLEKKDEQNNG